MAGGVIPRTAASMIGRGVNAPATGLIQTVERGRPSAAGRRGSGLASVQPDRVWSDDAWGALDGTSQFHHWFNPPWSELGGGPHLLVCQWAVFTAAAPASTGRVRVNGAGIDRAPWLPMDPGSNPGASGLASWSELVWQSYGQIDMTIWAPDGSTGTASVFLSLVRI